MDKRKVITAYQRGFITIQECAQILGMDSVLVKGMVNDPEWMENRKRIQNHQPANS